MVGVNRMPSSTADGSVVARLVTPAVEIGAVDGVALPKMLHGQLTLRSRVVATPMFALSSTPRTLIVWVPLPCWVYVKAHEVVPVAGCQVAPPSAEYSTAATTPPPVSAAVPVTVTDAPFA